METSADEEEMKKAIRFACGRVDSKHIIIDDIFASINYMNCLAVGLGNVDDIDHLVARRIRSVGELLQNQFKLVSVLEACDS